MDHQYPPTRTKPKVSAFRNLGALITAIRILKLLKSMLSGYKTYLLSSIGIVTAVLTYLAGELSLTETLRAVFEGLVAMTIRHGISKSK